MNHIRSELSSFALARTQAASHYPWIWNQSILDNQSECCFPEPGIALRVFPTPHVKVGFQHECLYFGVQMARLVSEGWSRLWGCHV
jgi:hypothetical protein